METAAIAGMIIGCLLLAACIGAAVVHTCRDEEHVSLSSTNPNYKDRSATTQHNPAFNGGGNGTLTAAAGGGQQDGVDYSHLAGSDASNANTPQPEYDHLNRAPVDRGNASKNDYNHLFNRETIGTVAVCPCPFLRTPLSLPS